MWAMKKKARSSSGDEATSRPGESSGIFSTAASDEGSADGYAHSSYCKTRTRAFLGLSMAFLSLRRPSACSAPLAKGRW